MGKAAQVRKEASEYVGVRAGIVGQIGMFLFSGEQTETIRAHPFCLPRQIPARMKAWLAACIILSVLCSLVFG